MIRFIIKRKHYILASIATSLLVYLFGLYITFDYGWILEFINFESPRNRLETLGRFIVKSLLDIPVFIFLYEYLNNNPKDLPTIKNDLNV